MSFTKVAMHFALKRPDILSYESFLFFGPHPDDIEIGAGATIAKLSALGKKIRFVICTDGRYGSDVITPDDLSGIRREEAIASASKLGVDDVVFLNLSDGAFYKEEELFNAMARAVSDFNPDIIFAPDPFVSNECHRDHLNVGDAARNLACFAPFSSIMGRYGCNKADVKAIAFYMTAKPNVYVKTGGNIKKQFEALKCHKSQAAGLESVYLYLRLRSLDFGLRRFSLHAEGFRAYTQTEMHCLPERGE